MKSSFSVIAFMLLAFIDINDIATINALKRSAEEAFLNKNYEQAASDYSMLLDSLQVVDDRALLNLGHAYFQLNDSSNARSAYQQLAITNDRELKSIAYQQLGMLNSSPEQLEKSLHFFKEAVRADPANEEARYNYELVKKKLEDQEQNQDQNQDQKNQDNQEKQDQENKDEQQQNDQQQEQQQQDQEQQDQENSDEQQQDQQQQEQQQDQQNSEEQQQQNQEQQEGEQEQSEEQQPQEGEEQEQQNQEEQPMPTPSEKLEEMNLSEEKARMILEAMRNSEVQYLQQMKKKATKKADSKKPDW